MDQKQETIVSITDNAAEKVKTLLAQEGEEDLALRIGVRPGGCSGFQYSIYFDDEVNDDDEVFETKGVRVLIDAMSVPYIVGSEFDYVDGLMGAGFAVNNPNVQGGCGCGSSFTCLQRSQHFSTLPFRQLVSTAPGSARRLLTAAFVKVELAR